MAISSSAQELIHFLTNSKRVVYTKEDSALRMYLPLPFIKSVSRDCPNTPIALGNLRLRMPIFIYFTNLGILILLLKIYFDNGRKTCY